MTLTREHPVRTECKVDLPLYDRFTSEDEALQQALRYGADLVDGLLPTFDPQRMC